MVRMDKAFSQGSLESHLLVLDLNPHKLVKLEVETNREDLQGKVRFLL